MRSDRAGARWAAASSTFPPTWPIQVSRSGSIATALEAFGRIDCLVNNVGWAEIHRFEELTEEIWERSFPDQPDERRPRDAGRSPEHARETVPEQS